MNQFVSNLFKSTVNKVVNLGLSKDLPNVSIGDRLESNHGIWTLYQGTMRDSGLPVTIFHFDTSNYKKDYFPLAQNAYKKMKSIRHPELLRFVDGAMTETSVYLVTDRVVPFHLPMDSQFLMLGMWKVATLLQFLNFECNLLHANIHPNSIFMTEAGEMKLGGLELVSNPKDPSPTFLTHASLMYSSVPTALPPEFQTVGPHFPSQAPFAPDLFFFGQLISPWIQQLPSLASHLQPLLLSFLAPSPSQRAKNFLDFLKTPIVNQPIITFTKALETLPAMNEQERVQCIEQLSLVMESFPINFKVHKILPILLSSLELGTVPAKSLIPVFKLINELNDIQFQSVLVEPLLKLFASTDRALRMALLDHLDTFLHRLDSKLIQTKIFPSIVVGFQDVVPVIREHTLKSMVVLAPKLNERLINHDVLKWVGQLQTDLEPTIRTNACVCLAKLAPFLTNETRTKILVPGFLRSLKDTFTPTKLAGVSSMLACFSYFDRTQLSTQVIPALGPLLIDMDANVVEVSFSLMDQCIAHLKSTIPPISTSQDATSVPVRSNGHGHASSQVSHSMQSHGSKKENHSSVTNAIPVAFPFSTTSSSSSSLMSNAPKEKAPSPSSFIATPSSTTSSSSTILSVHPHPPIQPGPPKPMQLHSSPMPLPIQNTVANVHRNTSSFPSSSSSSSVTTTTTATISSFASITTTTTTSPLNSSLQSAFQSFFPPPTSSNSTSVPSSSSFQPPIPFPPPPTSSTTPVSQSTSQVPSSVSSSSTNGWDTPDPWVPSSKPSHAPLVHSSSSSVPTSNTTTTPTHSISKVKSHPKPTFATSDFFSEWDSTSDW